MISLANGCREQGNVGRMIGVVTVECCPNTPDLCNKALRLRVCLNTTSGFEIVIKGVSLTWVCAIWIRGQVNFGKECGKERGEREDKSRKI